MTAHNPDTREKLPICERLEAWAKVSFSQDRARDLLKARDTIEALYEALKALRGNIGCASLVRNPVGIRLRANADAALSRARNEQVTK